MVVVLHLGLFDVRTKNTTQKERFKTTNLNVVAYLQCIIKIILNMTALFSQFSFIVYQFAIMRIIIIFVNYLASKIHEKKDFSFEK